MKKYIYAVGASTLLPFVVSAQTTISDAESVFNTIQNWITYATILFLSLLTLFFIWGAFKFGTAGANEEAKASGKAHMINSIIGIFAVFMLWGIINVILNSFAPDTNTANLEQIGNTTITSPGFNL